VIAAFKPAGNLHDARRLSEPLSHYFYVMTNGYGGCRITKAQVTPGGSVGHCGVYSRAATQPDAKQRCAAGSAGGEPERHRGAAG